MSARITLVPVELADSGGLSIDVRILANGLLRYGYDVDIVGIDVDGERLTGLDAEVSVVALPPAGPKAVARLLHLGRGVPRAIRDRPGVVHLFGVLPSYLTFAALAAARRARTPIVWTTMFHPARDRVWSDDIVRAPMRIFDAAATRAVRFADVVAVATEGERRLFEARGARRTVFMPPVVEDGSRATDTEAAAIRERFGFGSDPLVVVVSSRDEPRKGLQFGYETFARLRRDRPDAHLLVVGHASPGGSGEGVRFAGRVSDADVAAALHAADVVFVPSVYEGFSRIVIEAWHQGTPVVVTDGVGLAELADRGGAVVRHGDVEAAAGALGRLLADPAAARALGAAGAGLVAERFSEKSLLATADSTYRQLLGPNWLEKVENP